MGYVWLLLDTFGYFWLLMTTFGYFWIILAIFGSFWLLLVTFGYFWLLLAFSKAANHLGFGLLLRDGGGGPHGEVVGTALPSQ